jgi:hypothetical protein
MKILVAIFLIVCSLSVFVASIIKNVHLDQECTGYLKRASDANTVEAAEAELSKAINYLESNNLTTGHTSVLWKTPDEDIAFWYNNIKASQNELLKVDSASSMTERTNILMKLRETLIDNGAHGDHLTMPSGLSKYPNNALWGTAELMAVFALIFSGLVLFLVMEG